MTAVLSQIDVEAAQRRAERIRFHATNANDAMAALRKLVNTARELDDHITLGYASWTAYIRDLFGDEPLRLARDVRQELVAELSAQGMSTRAIAPIVGVDRKTIERDVRGGTNVPPAPVVIEGVTADPATGEVIEPSVTEHTVTEKVRTVTGLDGKEYKRPETQAPRSEPITSQFTSAVADLNRVMSRLRRISEDKNFPRNTEQVASLHASDLSRTISELEYLAELIS